MKKKSILVAHNNVSLIDKMYQFFNEKDLYYVSKHVTNGDELIRLGNLDSFDIVIAKDALTQISALYALENLLINTKYRPELILLISPFMNNFITSKCIELGISHFSDSKLSLNDIYNIVNKLEIDNAVVNKRYFEPQKEIINLLKKIGLLKTYTGYSYFEYVLNIMLEKGENIYKYMNTLYSMIAKHFDVSTSSVEKAMRTCIKASLSKSDGFYANLLFGHNHDSLPSTSMFLQVCIKTLKEEKNFIINQQFEKSIRKI